jgi:hypothetical protein
MADKFKSQPVNSVPRQIRGNAYVRAPMGAVFAMLVGNHPLPRETSVEMRGF